MAPVFIILSFRFTLISFHALYLICLTRTGWFSLSLGRIASDNPCSISPPCYDTLNNFNNLKNTCQHTSYNALYMRTKNMLPNQLILQCQKAFLLILERACDSLCQLLVCYPPIGTCEYRESQTCNQNFWIQKKSQAQDVTWSTATSNLVWQISILTLQYTCSRKVRMVSIWWFHRPGRAKK